MLKYAQLITGEHGDQPSTDLDRDPHVKYPCYTVLATDTVFTKTVNNYSYGTALLVGRSRDRFPVVSLGIFSVATDGTMCPGVDSASKNEYQGFLLG